MSNLNVVKDYFDTMPYLALLFPKIMHNGNDVTGSLYIVRQAAWVFWKLDKYSKANPGKEINLIIRDNIDTEDDSVRFVVNQTIDSVSRKDIELLCVMLIYAKNYYNPDKFSTYLELLDFCVNKYYISRKLHEGIMFMLNNEGTTDDATPTIKNIYKNFFYFIVITCIQIIKLEYDNEKEDENLEIKLSDFYKGTILNSLIFDKTISSRLNPNSKIEFINSIFENIFRLYVKDDVIYDYLKMKCNELSTITDSDTEINGLAMSIVDDLYKYIYDVFLKDITGKVNVGTIHTVELHALLDNPILSQVTTIGNSLKLTQHNSFFRSFEPLQDEKLSFSHDDSGSIILRDTKGEKINISIEIAKQTNDLCNVFGGVNTDFNSDCSNLYAYCFNNKPSEFKKEFKELTNFPTDLNIWDNINISKDKQKYIAYKILTTFGINGENYSLGIKWIKNGSPYLSDNDICLKAGIDSSDQLKVKKLNYIKALMTKLNNIIIMNTQNRKFGVYEYTPINMEKTKIHNFNLMLGMPGIPLQFGAGAKGKLPILYGGKITDNILNIINPIYKLIENIENKGITINIDKIRLIQYNLDLLKAQAQHLENAEEEIAIYSSLLQKSPNKPPLINETDFEAELVKVRQKKEENIQKLEKNMEKVGKIQDSLIRFLN